MATLFEKYKTLHGFPKNGQKVKYVKPTTHHWFVSVVENEKLLELGKEYTVSESELNSSSSYIWLEEFPEDEPEKRGKFFNLGAFDWEPILPTKEELIGMSVLDLFRMTTKLNCRIDRDDNYKIWVGDKLILSPIYDEFTGTIVDFED